MKIISIRSKAIKRLMLKNDPAGLPSQYVQKIRKLVKSLQDMPAIEDFLALPKGRPHKLKGDRAEYYAITVYANWRLTFLHQPEDNTIHILDFEDYH